MLAINEAFTNALLADATYVANLSAAVTPGALTQALSDRMTPTLAAYIGKNFSVVTQIESGLSSFDATVWRANNADGTPNPTGKIYVSMRGTQQLTDFLVDADLAITGNARAQVTDMVNWWLRISTPVGQQAKQIQALGPLYVAATSVPGEGIVSAADLAAGIEVNGHSLGGYLATAFTRLFGAQAHVQHTSTFNSAGFAPGSEAVFTSLQNLIGPSYGLGRFPSQSEQTNYFAKHGLNFTTNSFYFNQQGQRVELFNEFDATQIGNHFMYKLTDTLALADALAKLDPSLNFSRLNTLLEGSANKTEASLEGILDGLRKTILGGSILATPVGDVSGSAPSRTAYYANLNDLLKPDAKGNPTGIFANLQGNVQIVPPPGDGLVAKTDFGALLTLKYGLPFELKGIGLDSVWQQVQPDLFAQWQQDQRLSVADQAAGKANFSDRWLIDRAHYVEALLVANTAKNNNATSFDGDTWIATDKTTGRTLTLMPIGASGFDALGNPTGGTNNSAQVNQIIFGGDGKITGGAGVNHLYAGSGDDTLDGSAGKSDYLQGGAGNDSLLGGTGDDILYAGSGNTTLNGGKGNDTLYGGSGIDTFQFATGDGKDTLINGNAQSRIVIDGATLSGGKAVITGGKLWKSADDKITYALLGTSGNYDLAITYGNGDAITVKNYTPGALGISLQDGAAIATTDPVITNPTPIVGKAATAIINGAIVNYTDYQEGVDGAANINGNNSVVTDNGRNSIRVGNGNNSLTGGIGNDTVIAGAGDNVISGGGGQDYIFVDGGGNNVISANGGQDIIYAGNGNNRIYAGAKVDLAAAIDQAQQASASGLKGNFITVGSGNNTIVGGTGSHTIALSNGDNYVDLGSGNSTVSGGMGNDTIFGGTGNDKIDGKGGNDALDGGAGNDYMDGKGGADETLCGVAANDSKWEIAA